MKLSSLEIKKQEFKQSLRGYDSVEVRAFLDMIAMQWEELRAEQRRSEDKLVELKTKLEHYERVEMALQEALQTARESSKHALENARQEAALRIKEAEAKAEDIKRAALRERDALQQEVEALLDRRTEIVARLRAFLMSEVELLARYEGNVKGERTRAVEPAALSASELNEVLASLEAADVEAAPRAKKDELPEEAVAPVDEPTEEADTDAPAAVLSPEEVEQVVEADRDEDQSESYPVAVPEIEVEYIDEGGAQVVLPEMEEEAAATAADTQAAVEEADEGEAAPVDDSQPDHELFMPKEEAFMSREETPVTRFYEEKEPLSFAFFQPQEEKKEHFMTEKTSRKRDAADEAPKKGRRKTERAPAQGRDASENAWIVKPVVSAPHTRPADSDERTASGEEIEKIRRILNDLE